MPSHRTNFRIQSTGLLCLIVFGCETEEPKAEKTASQHDPNCALTVKGQGSDAKASAYYKAIGAPETLGDWRKKFCLSDPQLSSALAMDYRNRSDLGLGRKMECVDCFGRIACLVTNYADPDTPPDKQFSELAHGKAGAAVAMTYEPSAKERERTQFYVYGPDEQLATGLQLDAEGVKYAPTVCHVCHGGRTNAKNGRTLDANFTPFLLHTIEFDGPVPQEPLRKLNALVVKTNPTEFIKELINTAYGNCGVDQLGCEYDDSRVPKAWDADTPPPGWPSSRSSRGVWNDLTKNYCMGCHASHPSYLFDDPKAFGFDFVKAAVCAETRRRMPQALVQRKQFQADKDVIGLVCQGIQPAVCTTN